MISPQEHRRWMTIGITGADGFIGEHLRIWLQSLGHAVKPANRAAFACREELHQFVSNCDAIFHLAGANRGDDAAVYETNLRLTNQLISALEDVGTHPHVVFASSTQRNAATAYGRSKRDCEDLWRSWALAGEQSSPTPGEPPADVGSTVGPQVLPAVGAHPRVTVAVVPNVYGAGCRPFYNSVVATFCHQLANGETPSIHQDRQVEFVWVNDLVRDLAKLAIDHLASRTQPSENPCREATIAPTAVMKVSELLQLLREFQTAFFQTGIVPCLRDPLRASLYTTFLYYISLDQHQHEPQVHADQRGHLFEIIKLADGGQVFFSSTRPGVIRGNHYHTRKVEWFCVLKGEALIRLRRVGTDQIHEFRVSGDRPRFISIPVMHTHNIQNVGEDELLTMFWCNEIFDPQNADTIYENVT